MPGICPRRPRAFSATAAIARSCRRFMECWLASGHSRASTTTAFTSSRAGCSLNPSCSTRAVSTESGSPGVDGVLTWQRHRRRCLPDRIGVQVVLSRRCGPVHHGKSLETLERRRERRHRLRATDAGYSRGPRSPALDSKRCLCVTVGSISANGVVVSIREIDLTNRCSRQWRSVASPRECHVHSRHSRCPIRSR